MPPQTQNSTLTLLVCISLLTFIIQSACESDKVTISNDNKVFISKVIGDWTVQEYATMINDTSIILSRSQDSLFISRYDPQQTYSLSGYSIDDSVICTLPYIENIENWTIIQNNDNLFLETRDFCGNSNNFNIYFNNIYYYEAYEMWGRTYPPHYTADLTLTNQSAVIEINNLNLDQNPYNIGEEITFYINQNFYRLVRFLR
jgi:hypothetical protein